MAAKMKIRLEDVPVPVPAPRPAQLASEVRVDVLLAPEAHKKPEGPAFGRRDVHIIEEVKNLLDQLAIDRRDPVLRKAVLEELVAEATTRLEGLT